MTSLSQEAISEYIAAAGKAVWEVPQLDPNTKTRPVSRVGVIGAGTMGGGISMNFATA